MTQNTTTAVKADHPLIHLVKDSSHGVFPFFKATHTEFVHDHDGRFSWTSRDHRKGRHRAETLLPDPNTGKPHRDSIWIRVGRMRRLEWWNVSWWVAILYTLGSAVWVINGFFSFLPFCNSHVANSKPAILWSAWVGATIFEFASFFVILEAWNRDDTASFGWEVRRTLRGKGQKVDGDEESAQGLQKENKPANPSPTGSSNSEKQAQPSHPVRHHHWIWWTTDTKYWREIGFVAGFVQLSAATIFWISGWTGVPEVQNAIGQRTGLLNGVYWTPQVIGGSGFIISSALYMLETQHKWYVPAVTQLGWHIGFWNCVGGVGFTLCGIFGYFTTHELLYESALSTFWGGWAFLIGSVLQWYESVNGVQATEAEADDGA